MKKNKNTTIELCDIINIDEDLNINERNYHLLIYLYDIYDYYKYITLTYKGEDLKKYALRFKNVKCDFNKQNNWELEIDKIGKKYFQKCLLTFSATFGGLIAISIGITDKYINDLYVQRNTDYIYNNFVICPNDNGIAEIDLDAVASYDDYRIPTENAFFRVTNPFYNFKKYHVVLNEDTLKNSLNGDLLDYQDDRSFIQIADDIYSVSDQLTYATFTSDGNPMSIITYYKCDDSMDKEIQIAEIIKHHSYIKNPEDIQIVKTVETKLLDEIPTISVNTDKNDVKVLQKN